MLTQRLFHLHDEFFQKLSYISTTSALTSEFLMSGKNKQCTVLIVLISSSSSDLNHYLIKLIK